MSAKGRQHRRNVRHHAAMFWFCAETHSHNAFVVKIWPRFFLMWRRWRWLVKKIVGMQNSAKSELLSALTRQAIVIRKQLKLATNREDNCHDSIANIINLGLAASCQARICPSYWRTTLFLFVWYRESNRPAKSVWLRTRQSTWIQWPFS